MDRKSIRGRRRASDAAAPVGGACAGRPCAALIDEVAHAAPETWTIALP